MAGANKGPYQQDAHPPIPTPRTRFLRTFVAWQLVRFVAVGWRIIRLMTAPQR